MKITKFGYKHLFLSSIVFLSVILFTSSFAFGERYDGIDNFSGGTVEGDELHIATEKPSGKGRIACASKTISSGYDQSDVTVSFYARGHNGVDSIVRIDGEEFRQDPGPGKWTNTVQSENFSVQLCLIQTWMHNDPANIFYSNVRIDVQEYIPPPPPPPEPETPEPPKLETPPPSKEEVRDSDFDGIRDSQDACPYEREIINGYEDSDGCPDAAPTQQSNNELELHCREISNNDLKVFADCMNNPPPLIPTLSPPSTPMPDFDDIWPILLIIILSLIAIFVVKKILSRPKPPEIESPPPDQVTNLTGVDGVPIQIDWDTPNSDSPITNYKIYRDDSLHKTVGVVNQYMDNTNLVAGNTYVYEVSAVSKIGEGQKSTSVSVYAFQPPPRTFFTSVKLDEDQEKAVQYPYDKPLIVTAGPGSGKTRVVAERVKDIILEQGVSANRVLCLSFTKNAGNEMKERFRTDKDLIKYGKSIGDDNVRTIHSLGSQIAGSETPMVTSGSKSLLSPEFKKWQKTIKAADYPIITKSYPENSRYYDFRERLQSGVSAWKKEELKLNELNEYISQLSEDNKTTDKDGNIANAKAIKKLEEFEKYFEEYENFLADEGRIDFDDQIIDSIRKLRNNDEERKRWAGNYDHIIVDEFQDNNHLQTELAKLLAPEGHITVVGDEDQCIFTWQGAHVENFNDLKDHFKDYNPAEMILRTNYRSTEEIVEKSQNLMNVEKDRRQKDLKASEGNGKGVSPELWECKTKEDEFTFIKNKISELNGTEIDNGKPRAVVLFRKGVEMAEFKAFVKNNAIKTSTIHGVKGSEYSIVFIAHVESGSIPVGYKAGPFVVPVKLQKTNLNISDSIAHQREERRNLYVAMTRAKKQLFLTYHTEGKKTRSKFLNDIDLKPQNYE